jgi:succinate dehydrogenase / fumarate reductase membrane anchor subunit
MSLRSPVRHARGLGSAGTGTEHWLAQRFSAVALVPLGLWFAISLLLMPAVDFYTVTAWAAEPLNAVLVSLLVIAACYHSHLGTQVIAEDYLHQPAARVTVLVVLKLLHAGLAIAGVVSVVLIAARDVP